MGFFVGNYMYMYLSLKKNLIEADLCYCDISVTDIDYR